MASFTAQAFVLSGIVIALSTSVLASEGRFRGEIKGWSDSLYAQLRQQAPERKRQKKNVKELTLTINLVPADAKVRIMNIKPRYKAGMELPAGAYDVQITAPSYKTLRTWIELDVEHQVFQARLNKL